MIRPLRSRHRAVWVVLALALPVLVAAGLAARRPVPPVDGLPAALEGASFAADEVTFSQRRRVPGRIGIAVRHLKPALEGGLPRLALELIEDPRRPELLAYWSAGSDETAASLPGDALLLGRLAPGRDLIVDLPAPAVEEPGRLVIYSLAQSEVVDVLALRPAAEEP